MAKKLGIGIATVKRKIKKMSNVSYIGSGYSGHWEIKQFFETAVYFERVYEHSQQKKKPRKWI